MEKTNLENLNKLAKLFGTDRLISPEEIQEIRGVLVGVLANNKKELESLTAETRELVNKVLNKVLDEHDTYLEKSKQIVQEAKSDTTEAIQATMKSLEEVKKLCKEVMDCKPENGKDADEEYVIGEVLNRIKLPEYKEVVLDDGGAIVDKINALPVNEENQIDAKHIKNLPEFKNGRWSGITKGAVIKLIQESGSAGVTLKVGGTNNVDQGTLDLIAGSGITIVDNGDGTVTFTASGGSGSPGGSTTQLQYNNGGAFGGISGATTDGTAVTYTTGNLKVADVKASSSAGIQTLSNNGTVIALQGAGGGANNTFYGDIKADYATASTVPYFDVSKNLISSAVTPTELGYVSGVTSNIQTQLNAKEPTITTLAVNKGGTGQTTYTNGQLLIGNTTGNTLTKATLTGTSNQVVVTNGGGSITLSTPQDIGTSSNPQFATIELGAASDTTISRSSAGVLAVEGVVIPSISSTNTLTNKFITPQVQSVADASGTLTPVSITNDIVIATALSQATTIAAPTGSPVQGERLVIRLKDNGTARALTWNAIYRAIGVTLPTTTVISKTVYCGFIYNSTDTKWDCVAVAQEA